MTSAAITAIRFIALLLSEMSHTRGLIGARTTKELFIAVPSPAAALGLPGPWPRRRRRARAAGAHGGCSPGPRASRPSRGGLVAGAAPGSLVPVRSGEALRR